MKKIFTAALVAALTMTGCSDAQRTAAKDAALDCVHQDLGQTVPEIGMSLLYAVVSVVYNGNSDWQANLTSLGLKYGKDAVACAAHVAEELFRTSGSGSGAGPSTGEQIETPHDRAAKATAGYTFR